MFSARFHWDLQHNRLTELLTARRREGARILDLTESNPTRAGFRYPVEAVNALANERALLYQPLPAGSVEAREAVAAYYAQRRRAVSTERILLTASTSEAYAYLFKLLANPGDQVLVPRPSYPLFEFLADLESVEARPYPLIYDNAWSVDFDALEHAITDRTRAIIVVNPNNPTGSFLKQHELDRLAQICGSRGLALISDEVFSDYGFAPDGARVESVAGTEACLTFSMSGLSKIAGLPQMKLGWIVVSGPQDLRRQAFDRLEWIADTYLSVSTPVQCAAADLLRLGDGVQQQIRARCLENLQTARSVLRGSPGNILAVEGGWYIIMQVPRTRTEEEWTLELLGHDGVLVQPGFFFDFEQEAFLVASLLTKPVEFAEGIRRVVAALSR